MKAKISASGGCRGEARDSTARSVCSGGSNRCKCVSLVLNYATSVMHCLANSFCPTRSLHLVVDNASCSSHGFRHDARMCLYHRRQHQQERQRLPHCRAGSNRWLVHCQHNPSGTRQEEKQGSNKTTQSLHGAALWAAAAAFCVGLHLDVRPTVLYDSTFCAVASREGEKTAI